jgi:hypothetical protein
MLVKDERRGGGREFTAPLVNVLHPEDSNGPVFIPGNQLLALFDLSKAGMRPIVIFLSHPE